MLKQSETNVCVDRCSLLLPPARIAGTRCWWIGYRQDSARCHGDLCCWSERASRLGGRPVLSVPRRVCRYWRSPDAAGSYCRSRCRPTRLWTPGGPGTADRGRERWRRDGAERLPTVCTAVLSSNAPNTAQLLMGFCLVGVRVLSVLFGSVISCILFLFRSFLASLCM